MLSFNNLGNLGRLANQMFQYASLKGIAKNKGYEFTIPPLDKFGSVDPAVRSDPLNIYNLFNIDKKNEVGMYPIVCLQKECIHLIKNYLMSVQIM